MNFLYILSKQEFTSLYRFGQIPLRKDQIIESTTKSDQEIENNIFENFKSLAYFVGDEEYLIISFSEYNIESNRIDIVDVCEIIPMTVASRNSLKMKFDNRLDFKEPRYETVFYKFEEYIDIEERFNGAKAFWKLSKLSEPFHNIIEEDIVINSYLARVNGNNSNAVISYYNQILIYERYDFFPNTDLGFFYDAGEAFAHFKGHPTFKGSSFHEFLEMNKEDFINKSFIEIANFISHAEEVKKFTDQLTINNIKEYIVAALFQKFKTDLRERDSILGSETGKVIRYIKDDIQYYNELKFAIYLTGVFFGYKKFYDDLYSKASLKIFKNVAVVVEKPNATKIILAGNEIINKNTFDDNPSDDTPSNDNLKETILDDIKNIILKNSKGQVKVEKDILKEFQSILKPLIKSKKPKKPEIIDCIKVEYFNELQIIGKDTISIKKGSQLSIL